MSLEYISVHAWNINIKRVVEYLKAHGVVVLVTMKTHAIDLSAQASDELGIDVDDKEGPYLLHLSFEVDNQGWEDCLMYSDSADYQPDELREITIRAIRDWIACGEKDYHVCKMRIKSIIQE